VAHDDGIRIRRLTIADRELAEQTFAVMTSVFGENRQALSGAYLDRLLARQDFWGFAATDRDTVVGGLTAHVLMMTAYEGAEVFLYDIAVAPTHQRRGVGRQLVAALRDEARSVAVETVFVAADADDAEAVAFYSALG